MLSLSTFLRGSGFAEEDGDRAQNMRIVSVGRSHPQAECLDRAGNAERLDCSASSIGLFSGKHPDRTGGGLF